MVSPRYQNAQDFTNLITGKADRHICLSGQLPSLTAAWKQVQVRAARPSTGTQGTGRLGYAVNKKSAKFCQTGARDDRWRRRNSHSLARDGRQRGHGQGQGSHSDTTREESHPPRSAVTEDTSKASAAHAARLAMEATARTTQRRVQQEQA